MKFRTDFVTTSRSSSFAVIDIQSKDIAQLLQKYDTGEIQWNMGFKIEEDEIRIEEMDTCFCEQWPEQVEDVLSCLILFLTGCEPGVIQEPGFPEDYDVDSEIIPLLEEACQRKQELTDSIQSVHWHTGEACFGESEGMGYDADFCYDREKGISIFSYDEGEEEDEEF